MSATPADSSAITRLQQIRPELLKLHKALLYSERSVYEKTHGPIANSGEFFRLVTEDEAFNWLRPISKFIVQIDELLDLRKKEISFLRKSSSSSICTMNFEMGRSQLKASSSVTSRKNSPLLAIGPWVFSYTLRSEYSRALWSLSSSGRICCRRVMAELSAGVALMGR
ncbi:MAG: hypothetical protein ABG776_11660 [Cyanobacteria bacterium J06555_13]